MTVKVYAMTCGWVTMPMNSLLEGEEGTLLVPVPSYLIDHPKGAVLFDTGLHNSIFTDKAGYLGKMAKWLDVTFHPGEEISARLGALDRDVARIETGIERAIISVLRTSRRNRKRMIVASRPPTKAALSTFETLSEIKSA